MWLKSGSPEKIHIAELKLGTKENVHLRKLIFGASSIENFDGVHLCGPGAARHFTYRSVQAIKEVLPKSEKMRAMADKSGARPSYRRTGSQNQSHSSEDHTDCPQARYQRRHTDCPQAMYQRRQVARASASKPSYAQIVKGGDNRGYSYSVPTSNRFTFLA